MGIPSSTHEAVELTSIAWLLASFSIPEQDSKQLGNDGP